MTERMTPGTSRHAAAMRFGAELTRAMRKREVGQKSLQDAAKVSRASIVEFRNGRNLPTTVVAQRLAESLRWPILATIVEEARTGACETCGAVIRLDTGTRRRYCSVSCRSVSTTLGRPKERQASAAARLDAVSGALDAHRAAVAAMCAGCEPEGRCRDVECPLRPVSPLPLARSDVEAETAVKAKGRWGRPESHEAWAEHMRRKHAEGGMGDMRERSLAMWASLTPEQREARAQAIRDGRRRQLEEKAA